MAKTKSTLQALIDGLVDGGIDLVTNFPGFKSHELFEGLGGSITSVNEKAAYEIAWGASLAGKRSVVTFKNVGLDDAADPFLNSMVLGVNGGMVIVVFDDVEVTGSQSRQDSRHYADFFEGLWFEPYSASSAYEIAYDSFDLSERFQIPVVIRITNQVLSKEGSYIRQIGKNSHKKLIIDHKQFVIHPVNAKYQYYNRVKRGKAIDKYINELYLVGDKKKAIAFGNCDREITNAKLKEEDTFQIFTLPVPSKVIQKTFNNQNTIEVFEQGSSYGVEKIKSIFSTKKIASNEGDFPNHSSGYIITQNYEKLFKPLLSIKPTLITGDLGEYTKDTLDSIDACLCFGSSISIGIGAALVGINDIFCITGDAAFLHSGKNVIPEAIARRIKVNIIVICNGGSQGTGGQTVPGEIEIKNEEISTFKANYNSLTQKEFKSLFQKMSQSDKLSILYLTK